jgi:hypothetical protein
MLNVQERTHIFPQIPILGKTIDGAIIQKKLGQGGMGSVYQARHITLDKMVAIKILPPETQSAISNIPNDFYEKPVLRRN